MPITCEENQHWDENLEECVDSNIIPSPIINDIGFTSVKVTSPSSENLPDEILNFNLLYQIINEEVPEEEIETISLVTGVLPETISIVDNLLPNTKYKIWWESGPYYSERIILNMEIGKPGPIRNYQTICQEDLPILPGPVTFDSPSAYSVICIHRDYLPSINEVIAIRLVYREYKTTEIIDWITYPNLTPIVRNQGILVEGLLPNVEYEFRYEIENSVGTSYGPIARFDTNDDNSAGELIPNKPIVSNYPCPDGRNKIKVIFPALVGSAITSQLEINDSSGWYSYGESVNNENYELDVTDLIKNTTYFLRIIQKSNGNIEYSGKIAEIRTLPDLPIVPEKVDFLTLDKNSAEMQLPPLIPDLSWYALERGTGNSELNINWEKRWERLSPLEIFPDVNLEPDKIYWYRVIAVNKCGETAGPPDWTDTWTTAPEKPSFINVEKVNGSSIVFSTPELPTRASFIKFAMGLSPDNLEIIQDYIKPLDFYKDKNLNFLTTYYYRIVSLNKAGHTLGDITGIKTRAYDEAEEAPSPLIKEKGYQKLEIYSPNILPENTQHLILQIKESLSNDWETISDLVYTEEVISVGSELLEVGKKYYFRWIAVNNNMSNPSSNISSFELIAPEVPNSPKLLGHPDKIDITTPDLSNRTIYYNLQKNVNDEWITIGEELLNDTEIKDLDVQPATGYEYRVVGVGYYGETTGLVGEIDTLSYGDGNDDLPAVPPRPIASTIQSTYISLSIPSPFVEKADYLKVRIREINTEWTELEKKGLRRELYYSIEELIEDTFYEIEWIAFNSNGISIGDSLIVKSNISPPEAPDVPTLETA